MPITGPARSRSARSCRIAASPRREAATLLFVLLGLLAPAAAQQTQPATTQATTAAGDATAAAGRPTDLNLPDRDSLQALKEEFAAATGMEEGLRSKLVEAYTQALAHRDVMENARQKAARYAAEILTAPQRIQAAREQLEKLPDEPSIEVDPDGSIDELQQALTAAEADLTAAISEAEAAEKAARLLGDRRSEINRELAATQEQIERLEESLPQQLAEAPPRLAAARKAANLLAQQAAREHITALKQELLLLGAEEPLYTLNKDLTARRLALAEQRAQTLESWLNESRRRQAEQERREAERIRRAYADADPAVQQLAETNARLAERSSELTDRIKTLAGKIQSSEDTLERLNTSYSSIIRRQRHVGMTEAIGVLLQKERSLLPPVDTLRRELNALQNRLSKLQVDLMDLEAERADLAETDRRSEQVLVEIQRRRTEALTPWQRRSIRRSAEDLLEKQRDYLDALIQNHRSLIDDLTRLHTLKRQVLEKTRKLAEYIDERILWIRSTEPMKLSFRRSTEAGAWMLHPARWLEAARALGRDALSSPLPWIGAVMVLGSLLLLRRRITAQIVRLGEVPEKTFFQAAKITTAGTALSALLAAPCPLVLWVLAWRLRMAETSTDFCAAAAAGLGGLTLLAATVCLLRQLLRTDGLGDVDLHLPREPMVQLRRRILVLSLILAPLLWTVIVLRHQGREDWSDSLGRQALLAMLAVLAVFVLRLMKPSDPILLRALGRGRGLESSRYRTFVYPLLVAAPLVLAVLAGLGYYYPAIHLSWRLAMTFWLLIGMSLLNTAALHWLAVAAREILLRRRRQRQLAEESNEPGGADTAVAATGETVSIEMPELDFSQVSEQSRHFLRFVMIVLMVLGIWTIWADTLPALNWLDRVELWDVQREVRSDGEAVSLPLPGPQLPTDGESAEAAPPGDVRSAVVPVTLADVGLAVLVVVLAVTMTRSVPGMLEMTLLQRLNLDPGGRYAILAIFRYVLGVTAVVVVLALLGVNWSSVQWLVAAMTFGLAFGLQEIFANFIAGIIILFERPIRLGDTVSIGETTGTVSNIRIRATTITDWDRKELIVPNKEFVTNRLINWTLSDSILRLIIRVGAAYGSDTEKVVQALHRVAEANPCVLDTPAPVVLFNGFGDNALHFELRVYIGSIEHYLRTIHEVHMAIDRAFREAKITIAFPQRDVHFDPDSPLEIKLVRQARESKSGSPGD